MRGGPGGNGLNVTLIVQLEFAVSEVPQLFLWPKPRPVVLTVIPVKELGCLFVRVTAGGDGRPLQNVRLVGLRLTFLKNACMSLAVAAAPGKLVNPTASLIVRNRFWC